MAEQADNQGKKGNSTMIIVIVAIAVSIVLSVGIAAGMMVFLKGDDQTAAADGQDTETVASEPPIYHSMDPKFVVSFRNPKHARFMQFSLEVMARDRDVIEDIKKHSPAIRSSLLLLVDNQDSETMTTREGKEKLLEKMTADINQTLERIGGKSGVEAAYYNSFVIQ